YVGVQYLARRSPEKTIQQTLEEVARVYVRRFRVTAETMGPGAPVLPASFVSSGTESYLAMVWGNRLGSQPALRVNFLLEPLPGNELAEARVTKVDANGLPTEGVIVLSPDAAGVGWFIDPTPEDASEFTVP